jgi:GNAT superfamily N-acetyltransferase
MEDRLTIRRAGPRDAAGIACLSEVLGYPVETDTIAQRLGRLQLRPEDVVLVAEDESGHIIGWLHAADQELLECGRRCEIVGLVVAPEYRGRGAGRRLAEAAERWAVESGLEEMSVRSNVVRPDSHPFYERLGYSRIKTQHAYRKWVGGERGGRDSRSP